MTRTRVGRAIHHYIDRHNQETQAVPVWTAETADILEKVSAPELPSGLAGMFRRIKKFAALQSIDLWLHFTTNQTQNKKTSYFPAQNSLWGKFWEKSGSRENPEDAKGPGGASPPGL